MAQVEEWRLTAAAFVPPAAGECRDGQVAVYEYAARPSSAPKARAVLRGFLESCEVPIERISEILTATGEAVANAIEHAYDPHLSGPFFLSLYCCPMHARAVVQVRDLGTMRRTSPLPLGRGFGTLIMRALPSKAAVDTTLGGTTVTMLFRLAPQESRAGY